MSNIQVPNLAVQMSSVSLREEDATAINYDQISYKAPVYKMRQVPQISGGTNVVLSANSVSQSIWNCPDMTSNFSEGYIVFDAPCAGNATLNFGNVFHTDFIPIDSLKFKPTSGNPVVDITSVQQYTKVSQAMALSMTDYLSRGGVFGDTAIGASLPVSECTGCQPFSTQVLQDDSEIDAKKPSAAYIVNATGLVNRDVTNISNISGVTNDEKTPQRLVAGTFTAGSATTIRYKIPLSAFTGTALAINRSICYGQVMQLTVNWAPLTNWGFASLNTAAAPVSLAPITLTNVYLYLPEDISETGEYIKGLAHTSGLQLNVPYLDCSIYNGTGAAGTQSATYLLTPGMGNLLKRVMFLASNNTQTLHLTANLDNVNASRFASIQTYYDAKPLQDFALAVADSTLWQNMQPKIKNTPSCIDKRNYEINCFYMDNFSDADSSVDFPENDLKVSGLTVAGAQKSYYAKYTTLAANSNVYIYAVWSRTLVIKPTGLAWVGI